MNLCKVIRKYRKVGGCSDHRTGYRTISFWAFVCSYLFGISILSSVALVATPVFAATGFKDAIVNFFSDNVVLEEGITNHTQTLVLIYSDPKITKNTPADAVKKHQELANVQPNVEILGSLGNSASVNFSNYRPKGTVNNQHYWWVDMSVEGMEPGKDLEMPLWISYGEVAANPAKYTIKASKKQGALDWTVTAPAKDLVISENGQTNFMLTAGPRPAVDVDIKQSTLQDSSTKKTIGLEYLNLCNFQDQMQDQASDECKNITVGAQSDKAVLLKVKGFKESGTYTGNVTIGPNNEKAPKSFELTIYASSGLAKSLGWGAIILGLVVAFYVNVFAGHYLARAQALLAVTRVTDRLAEFLTQVNQFEKERQVKLPELTKRINELKMDLDQSTSPLSDLLPPRFPLVQRGNDDWGSKLKTHVEAVAGQVAVVDVLVQEGLLALDTKWESAHTQLYQTAMQKLDEKSADAMDIAEAELKIEEVFTDLEISKQGEATDESVSRIHSKISVEQLEFKIGLVSGTVWLIWLLVSVLAGAYVLIYTNPGFGIPIDYFKCLFWGLGFGVAGNQLDQITSTNVAQKFGISMPKAVT